MTERTAALKALHSVLVDSRESYEEALADAKGRGLSPLFSEMIAVRTKDAEDLARHLVDLGETVDDKGSFRSAIARTVIGLRALVTELDERVLPALIDSEEAILADYDTAIAATAAEFPEFATLLAQREAQRQKLVSLTQRAHIVA